MDASEMHAAVSKAESARGAAEARVQAVQQQLRASEESVIHLKRMNESLNRPEVGWSYFSGVGCKRQCCVSV